MPGQTLDSMLADLSAADRSSFLSKCTREFARVAEPQFNRISKSLGRRLKWGYRKVRIRESMGGNFSSAEYRIALDDFEGDVMAIIAERDGAVTGLVLKPLSDEGAAGVLAVV